MWDVLYDQMKGEIVYGRMAYSIIHNRLRGAFVCIGITTWATVETTFDFQFIRRLLPVRHGIEMVFRYVAIRT